MAQRILCFDSHARSRYDLYRRQPVHHLFHGRKEPSLGWRLVLNCHPRKFPPSPPPSITEVHRFVRSSAEMVLQISTAIGLAVTSAITTTVTVNESRDSLPSPDTLLEGYHVAGWICFSMAVIGLPLNFYSLRGLGVIGGMAGMPEVANRKRPAKSDGERCVSVAEVGVTKEKNAGFEG